MCGRFTTTIDQEELEKYFKISRTEGEYAPLYNAAPTQKIPVVREIGSRVLVFYRWGLVPSWAKDESVGYKLINARAETLQEKPSFRRLYKRRRCLIPVDGFFEWKKEGKTKKPMRIIMKDRSPFALAGLWDSWHAPDRDPLLTCTIITTTANALVGSIHQRMPVIISTQDYGLWLDPSLEETDLLQPLLKPYPHDLMDMYPVSPLINSPQNNTPEVILPV